MKYYGYLLAAAISSQAFAGTMGPEPGMTWVGSISAGPVWAHGGKTQTFYTTPTIERTWAAYPTTTVLPEGELFIGIQKKLPLFSLQAYLGLAGAVTGDAHLRGVIREVDSVVDSYSYRYRVQNSRIGIKGKFLPDKDYWLLPWVSGNVAAGFNRAHYYENTPLILGAVHNQNFTGSTRTTFTYALGAGVQMAFYDHWQIGLGYEFADWGQSALGRAADQNRSGGVTMHHLYTNGLLFNLTFIS